MKIVKLAKKLLLSSVLLLVSVLAPVAGAAPADDTTVYVSAEGKDDGTGSADQPYPTLQIAVEQAVAQATAASETTATVKLLGNLQLKEKQTLNTGAVEVTITSAEGGPYAIIRAEDYDGQMIVISGGKVIFNHLIIDGNDVAANNMGVYATGGTTTFEDVVLEKHHIAANSGTAVIFAYGGAAIIKEGTIIRNNRLTGISSSNPSAILSAGSGGHLIIEGGLITDNTVEEGSNAVIVGIGLYQSPLFTMTGGKITNNHLLGNGENEAGETVGNVAVNMRGSASQARFEFSGTSYVYDNMNAAGEQRNVFLKNTEATDTAFLSLTGPMVEGAKVGVYANIMPTSAAPIVDVGKGYSGYTATATDAVYFVSDKASQAEIQYNAAGQKVILAPIPPELDHVWLNQASVDGKEITLVFNGDIALTDLEGFDITVGGSRASIESFQVHGNELVIILAEAPTDDIALDYTAAGGNLEGLNGMPVADFTFHYEISFADNFFVTSPTGDPAKVADSRPQIKGTVDAGSTVEVIVKQDDAVVAGAGGSATVDEAGNWTFSPNADLEAGTYIFEITATSSDGTKVLTKTKEILVKNSPVAVNGRFIEGENTVTITFDRPVAFDAGSVVDGFSVSVGGTPVTVVSAAVYDADPTQVVLTLPEGTELSIDKPVYVAYEGETGHLIDAGEGGTSVEDFELYAEDPFAADLQITSPEGNVTDSTPTVTGTVYANTDTLSVTIQDSDGNPVDAEGTLIWEPGDPTWSYEVKDVLPPGTYTVAVTGTANGRSVTKEKTFIIDADEKLKLVKVTVDDATPDQATLIFNLPVKEGLTAADFTSFEISLRTVKSVKQIDGEKVIVELNEPFAPGQPLTVVYDETRDGSGIVSAGGASTELSTITPDNAEDQTAIDKANNVIPLAIVAAYVEDGKLKLIFNKNVDDESLDLSGLTYGGVSVQEPFEANGNEIIIPLPEGSTSNVLAYEADESNVQEANNVNNRLGDLTPGIDLGEDRFYLNQAGELTAGLGFVDGDRNIPLSPAFDVNQPNGYQAVVANKVSSIGLNPVPFVPEGAVLKVKVNGMEITDYDDLPLREGANAITVGVYDENNPHVLLGQYDITVIRASGSNDDDDDNSGSSGGSSNGGTAPSTPQPPAVQQPAVIEVTVDGVEDAFASGVVAQTNGRQVIAVQVEADLLNKALKAGERQELAIHSPNEADMNVTGLTVADVERLANTGTRLEVSNLLAIYPVPGEKLNISDISKQLGGAATKDIDVQIGITRATDNLIARAESKAAAEGYELLVDPVVLDMTFTHNGEKIRADLLDGYAQRYIALPEGIDLNRITTGVIVYPDGSVYHVPTVVTQIQNRYYALINDLRGNGTYSVIWNPQDFADVRGHWGQEDINNIAARLDLKGNGDNTFSPSRAITRSEFAEIVVLGLGLMGMEAANSQFPDVPDSAWYRHSVAIANEFGIVKGYDNGTFAGDQEITREQGIAMIARAYRLIRSESRLDESQINAVLANYEDRSAVAAWAREDMALMIQAGIVQGQDQQRLNPQTKITRAEVAALIARLLKTTDLIDK